MSAPRFPKRMVTRHYLPRTGHLLVTQGWELLAEDQRWRVALVGLWRAAPEGGHEQVRYENMIAQLDEEMRDLEWLLGVVVCARAREMRMVERPEFRPRTIESEANTRAEPVSGAPSHEATGSSGAAMAPEEGEGRERED